jgi:hypothetical protein
MRVGELRVARCELASCERCNEDEDDDEGEQASTSKKYEQGGGWT